MITNKFSVLHSGLTMLLIAIVLSILLFFMAGRKIAFSRDYFVMGLWLAALLMCAIIRAQMNEATWRDIPGALFSDFLWLLLIGLLLFGLWLATRRTCSLRTGIFLFSVATLFVSVLFSLMNIELVNQIGRPLNYQWLYYSDFMQGIDAENAAAQNLTWPVALNLAMLMAATLLLGFALSWWLFRREDAKKMTLIGVPIGLLFFISLYQYQFHPYSKSHTENPFLSIATSAIQADRKAPLFSVPVSPESHRYVREIHQSAFTSRYDTNRLIKNIVLFVFESTPQKYISLYDSTYDATPNLRKWKGAARIYNQVYAHIPSTPNTLFSLISGVYPLLSFRSAVKENPRISLPSLPGVLQEEGWASSLFFASDLDFSHMGKYAANQHFQTIKDYKTIACNRKKFRNSHSLLDGLDDQCLASEYLRWLDSSRHVQTFSMLWTYQTHYPYLTHEEKPQHYSNDKELNRYLSALKNGDKAFEALMQGLKKRNVLDSTLVIVMGDHGEAFGTHHQTIHATRLYEENVHIPCILYNPVLFDGSTDPQLGGVIDIPATICHVAGVKQPKQWQGKSLLNATNRNRTYFISPYSDFLLGTRNGDWKYIYNASTDQSELYNLAADPAELNNLAYQYPAKVQSEYQQLAAWVQYHSQKNLNTP